MTFDYYGGTVDEILAAPFYLIMLFHYTYWQIQSALYASGIYSAFFGTWNQWAIV